MNDPSDSRLKAPIRSGEGKKPVWRLDIMVVEEEGDWSALDAIAPLVEAAGRVVVAAAVTHRDIERDLEAAANFTQQETHEHFVRRRRLLGADLADVVAGRQREHRAAVDLHLIERLGLDCYAVRRGLAQ